MQHVLVIGLGNPDKRFDGTRHNLGQRVAEEICGQQGGAWREESGGLYRLCQASGLTGLIPLTYMNDSGRAVAEYLKYHPLSLEDVLIVHDDLELPVGEIARTSGGSAKGHNGVRSIQQTLGSQDIPRLRLGIGRPAADMPVDHFVLAQFTPEEKTLIDTAVAAAVQTINDLIISRQNQG
jgi:PTH1 family peptidyl-tRNA hydrolase